MNNNIKEKIAKLLALAESPNENEAKPRFSRLVLSWFSTSSARRSVPAKKRRL